MSFSTFVEKPHVKFLVYAEVIVLIAMISYTAISNIADNLEEMDEEELDQIANDNMPGIFNIIGIVLIIGVMMSIIGMVYSYVR